MSKNPTVSERRTQTRLRFGSMHPHPIALSPEVSPLYQTSLLALDTLQTPSPSCAAFLVLDSGGHHSPHYALHFKKEYGNVDKAKYVEWFLPFAAEIKRILKPDGSFVLNIGGSYNPGSPTRSLYHFKLLMPALRDISGSILPRSVSGNIPPSYPRPPRVGKCAADACKGFCGGTFWWLSPTKWPKANNEGVLVPYSNDMERLIEKGYRAKKRPERS